MAKPDKRNKSAKKGANPWADHFTRKAQKEGFAARSVYKLKEIESRYKIFCPGQRVLDLGCSPGSWLQFASKAVEPGGKVVGVDIKPVEVSLAVNAKALVGDVFDPEADWRNEIGSGFDLVLSDMAPKTSGIKSADALRSVALSEAALGVASGVLAPGGAFVCKVFMGEGFDDFVKQAKGCFSKTSLYKPQSTRSKSPEIYLIGRGFIKGSPDSVTDSSPLE
ncbi:MAG: RlmE family RNA methyltransferase [Desulfatibacillaceae bacterium]|nr:RlmE family RNA methyltransferase [Desulfatibacillaceae bacterium]